MAARGPALTRESAGLLLYRRRAGRLEVLLVHPGGPFWQRKDAGAWSIPKGEIETGEPAIQVALREFKEELGHEPPDAEAVSLGVVRQAGGKLVHAWAVAGDFDPATVASNTFTLEWPPRSGRSQVFPEVDRAEWFDLAAAREKLIAAQVALVERLEERLGGPPPE